MGTPLQEDLVCTTDHLLRLAQDILAMSQGPHTAALTAERVVIDYERFARIRDCRDRQGLTIIHLACTLGLHRETVAKWLARSRIEWPRPTPRAGLLDPCKGRITRLLDTHP